MRTTLLGCLLTTCLLGQVWSKHLLVETEPEVKSQEQGEIEDVIESKNKEEYDTESRLLGLLDEEDAEILKKMPKKRRKLCFNKWGRYLLMKTLGLIINSLAEMLVQKDQDQHGFLELGVH